MDKDLPGWLLVAADRREDASPGSVAEMIRNWNDDKNDIFEFRFRSEESGKFKASKRGQWMQQLPRFTEGEPEDADENLSSASLKHSFLRLILRLMLTGAHATDMGNVLY